MPIKKEKALGIAIASFMIAYGYLAMHFIWSSLKDLAETLSK